MKVIDSHVHLDLIEIYHPQRIAWLRTHDCAVVSWAYFDGIDSFTRLEAALQTKTGAMHRLSADGLDCHYLAGVHPRSIPPDLKPERIQDLLQPYMDDPLCLGIGEIGLETGSVIEREVLIAQLELGRHIIESGQVIGVHTPRRDKAIKTAETLAILAPFGDLARHLVVDHCTPDTIDGVLAAGFRAGVTLSPVKTSWDELKRIVAACPDNLDRIMCNTDSGSEFFEDVVTFSSSADVPATVREDLFFGCAARFFSTI